MIQGDLRYAIFMSTKVVFELYTNLFSELHNSAGTMMHILLCQI